MKLLSNKERESTNEIVKNDGFKVLKVKSEENSSVIRQLFIKQFILSFHKNNDTEDKPENRTLLIINVPPFVNEHNIRYLFEKCGKILRIYFQQKPSLSSASTVFNKIQCLDSEIDQKEPTKIPSVADYFKNENEIISYKVCYVVFNKPVGISNAIGLTQTDKVYCLQPTLLEQLQKDNASTNSQWFTGVKLWQKQYNDSIIAPYELKKIAESFIEEYGKKIMEKEQEDKDKAEDLADQNDQGWITINRKLRRDRRALFNDRYHDQQIQEKYKDRELKRKNEENEFNEQIEPIIKNAMKKKKKSRKTFDF